MGPWHEEGSGEEETKMKFWAHGSARALDLADESAVVDVSGYNPDIYGIGAAFTSCYRRFTAPKCLLLTA